LINAGGFLQWGLALSGSGADVGYSIVETEEGALVVAGREISKKAVR